MHCDNGKPNTFNTLQTRTRHCWIPAFVALLHGVSMVLAQFLIMTCHAKSSGIKVSQEWQVPCFSDAALTSWCVKHCSTAKVLDKAASVQKATLRTRSYHLTRLPSRANALNCFSALAMYTGTSPASSAGPSIMAVTKPRSKPSL